MNLFEMNFEEDSNSEIKITSPGDKVVTVSQYLDSVNILLKKQKARILGEVFGIQEYPGRSYMYFSVKDKEDQSTIKCFMWKKDYQLSGVTLTEGLEVVLSSYPAIYKPNGGLSLQVSSIELIGEGALKIAYEKLKAQFEREGLFDESRKREIPDFPKKIGIITSKSGAVINDFLSNIGKFGFELVFVDSKVEGVGAVEDLLNALRTLYKEDLDCLVLMRGGGSLESFQAFNNENIVRAVSKFNAPVITGIGHDKDVPLVSLVSDKNVSTPTAVANLLSQNFSEARNKFNLFEERIFSGFDRTLREKIFFVEESISIIEANFKNIFNKFEYFSNSIAGSFKNIGDAMVRSKDVIIQTEERLVLNWNRALGDKMDILENFSKNLSAYNPEKKLKQGYSIVRLNGKVLKDKVQASKGKDLEIQVSDGIIEAIIT